MKKNNHKIRKKKYIKYSAHVEYEDEINNDFYTYPRIYHHRGQLIRSMKTILLNEVKYFNGDFDISELDWRDNKIIIELNNYRIIIKRYNE
jgi:hypothetical protein